MKRKMLRKLKASATSAAMGLVVSGCATSDLPTMDERLERVGTALFEAADKETPASLIKTSQPEPYASIVRQNVSEMQFRFDDNLKTLDIDRLRVRQSRLPQIAPGLSTGSGGAASVELNIRQVLFSGNLSEAMFHEADVEAVGRQIALLETLNDDINDDIETYLSYRENLERAELLGDLQGRLGELLEIAETRLEGGVGTADEVALFQLELTEIETEELIARSNAQVDRSALEDINVSLAPRRFSQKDTLLPTEVLAAIAERDQARSGLAVAQEQTVPRVVLAANAGIEATTGIPSRNAGLRVEANPINFGGNADVLSAEQAVFFAERELEDTVTEVSRETRRLLQQISALQSQEVQTTKLADQAEARLDAFREQFEAGTSGITEAAGLVDILRRSLEQKVDVRYQILNLQNQLASTMGHYWTF